MKKICTLLIGIFLFLINIDLVRAEEDSIYEYYCTKEAAAQVAKIVCREVGANSATNPEDNFFQKISTAAVVVNNANRKSGKTFYEKIYNLTDNNYQGYSTYKGNSYNEIADQYCSPSKKEILYAAELVLTGKYTFKANMTLQASKSIVNQLGDTWTHVENNDPFIDMYFGYEKNYLVNTQEDIYKNKKNDTSVSYYKELANSLKKVDYSGYTTENVCSKLANGNGSSSSSSSSSSSQTTTTPSNTIHACTNPDVLKLIYFFLMILNIAKIAVPIALIVLGIFDFSKSIVSGDENTQKQTFKKFFNRILCAILIFALPWVLQVLMVTLGNAEVVKEVNYTDCLENANMDCIDALEGQSNAEITKYCDSKSVNTP